MGLEVQLFHIVSVLILPIFLPRSSLGVMVWPRLEQQLSPEYTDFLDKSIVFPTQLFLFQAAFINFNRISTAPVVPITNWKKAGSDQIMLCKTKVRILLPFLLNLFWVACSSGHVWPVWNHYSFTKKHPERYFDITVHVSMSFMVFPKDILNQDVNVKSWTK